MKNILNKINFKLDKSFLIVFLACLVSVLYVFFNKSTQILENSMIENLQVLALFVAMFFCFKTKNNKPFFIFAALVIFLMIARELSYGRVIFCQIEGNSHEFYSFSDLKYGFLVNYIIALYIAFGMVYAIIKKVWRDIFYLISNVKFPFWNGLFAFLCIFIQLISEKILNNTIIEESVELILYSIVITFVLIYSKSKKIIEK